MLPTGDLLSDPLIPAALIVALAVLILALGLWLQARARRRSSADLSPSHDRQWLEQVIARSARPPKRPERARRRGQRPLDK